jgi:hypothetical protein
MAGILEVHTTTPGFQRAGKDEKHCGQDNHFGETGRDLTPLIFL